MDRNLSLWRIPAILVKAVTFKQQDALLARCEGDSACQRPHEVAATAIPMIRLGWRGK
ncbi:hypothetical protein HFN54_28370 [Rhizobium leguminosarum]|uniref:hypothetical protein n=1 Tax=Rhizobium leguminosarum TaxID=384 RepID=UPI0013F17D5E|nr:hypothetical protein [Rhizobium leguminosarum]MBY5826366.1 hypothetical protein [Rhizobium leguminosarum]